MEGLTFKLNNKNSVFGWEKIKVLKRVCYRTLIHKSAPNNSQCSMSVPEYTLDCLTFSKDLGWDYHSFEELELQEEIGMDYYILDKESMPCQKQ